MGFSENQIPSGKRLHNYGKSPFLMCKSTISMAIFNSYVTNYQRVPPHRWLIMIFGRSFLKSHVGHMHIPVMSGCTQASEFPFL